MKKILVVFSALFLAISVSSAFANTYTIINGSKGTMQADYEVCGFIEYPRTSCGSIVPITINSKSNVKIELSDEPNLKGKWINILAVVEKQDGKDVAKAKYDPSICSSRAGGNSTILKSYGNLIACNNTNTL